MRKSIAIISLLFSMVFISCDQDYNTVGADLVGDEHFDFDKYEVDIKAYSQATQEVQTNNLLVNPLGFYKNPYFGDTKANFVTNVSLNNFQPKFGTNVQIENVTLYIPYFSTVDETNDDGSKTYTLDSIYGANPESKMKLSVYENGYYLSQFDANDQSLDSRYYNDMDGLIDAQKRGNDGSGNSVANGTRLNDSSDPAENDQFYFNKAEIKIYKTKFNTVSGQIEYLDENDNVTTDPTKYVVKERLAPGIYLNLNKQFFKKRILDASNSDLYNHNTFRQYFKGLYFQMEQVAGQDGAMAMLNFNNAKLNINYSSVNDGAQAGTAATSKTMLLSLGSATGGSTVSLQDYSYSSAYSTGLANSANVFGNVDFGQNERLYLKGGKGSVVYVDVFGDDKDNPDTDTDNDDGIEDDVTDESYHNGIPDELDLLRKKGWLINDAYLEFYIDNSSTVMGGANQEYAERIYLYDATNNKAIFDYTFDTSTSLSAKNNKYVYGGILQRDNDATSSTYKKGIKYKIRITQHINNILNSSNVNINKNVKLGLCVTESVAITSNKYFKNPLTFGPGAEDDIKQLPVSSIMAQQGTVLHGTHSTDPEKKLKLVIHYTKPN
ncbi:DUF4270 domain-containing protein [Flavobacterium urocaniciphilum]|uniref:DUF4270 domain-containing protein n=1 Tax=Flavobacterium urocaniciphilum TaxID=1299341 RepID=A0A1H9ABU1_9FLAO|nr:DUF4270 domain-containing protein [Flavobacterium urocaniciphilum]SEP74011.1 protein of unknown function [Flavobacterium urocaniciphilum]